jgi:hypothetical protein
VLHDWTGNYRWALQCFAVLSCLSVAAALAARRPRIGINSIRTPEEQ